MTFQVKRFHFSMIAPRERTKYLEPLSALKRDEFLVAPWPENLLDSENLTTCLHPMLKFPRGSLLMPINEVWFGLHLACLLNKALDLGILPVESGQV